MTVQWSPQEDFICGQHGGQVYNQSEMHFSEGDDVRVNDFSWLEELVAARWFSIAENGASRNSGTGSPVVQVP